MQGTRFPLRGEALECLLPCVCEDAAVSRPPTCIRSSICTHGLHQHVPASNGPQPHTYAPGLHRSPSIACMDPMHTRHTRRGVFQVVYPFGMLARSFGVVNVRLAGIQLRNTNLLNLTHAGAARIGARRSTTLTGGRCSRRTCGCMPTRSPRRRCARRSSARSTCSTRRAWLWTRTRSRRCWRRRGGSSTARCLWMRRRSTCCTRPRHRGSSRCCRSRASSSCCGYAEPPFPALPLACCRVLLPDLVLSLLRIVPMSPLVPRPHPATLATI